MFLPSAVHVETVITDSVDNHLQTSKAFGPDALLHALYLELCH